MTFWRQNSFSCGRFYTFPRFCPRVFPTKSLYFDKEQKTQRQLDKVNFSCLCPPVDNFKCINLCIFMALILIIINIIKKITLPFSHSVSHRFNHFIFAFWLFTQQYSFAGKIQYKINVLVLVDLLII